MPDHALTREQLGQTLNNAVDHGTVDDEDYQAIMAHDATQRSTIEQQETRIRQLHASLDRYAEEVEQQLFRLVQQARGEEGKARRGRGGLG